MKSVMISIQPKWCDLIVSGRKTIEVRKTRPICNLPFKCYIYETKNGGGSGKVIGEFICDEISKFTAEFVDDDCYEDIRYCYTTADDEEDKIIISTNEYINPNNNWLCNESHLSFNDIKKYIGTNFHEIPFYGWHISDLKIYSMSNNLSVYYKPCPNNEDCGKCDYYIWGGDAYEPSYCNYDFEPIKRPPQSWCYVELL